MLHLSEEQLQTIRALLDAREAELQDEVRAAREAAAERPSAQGPVVGDLVEEGEDRFRHGIEHAELQRDQEELREIARTRERIADGSYGQCVVCGRDINFERLRVQPTATRCLEDQQAWEKSHPSAPRFTV